MIAKRKRGKRKVSGVEQEARFPSQRLPQLSRVRLAKEQAWIVDAISRYQTEFLAEHGVPVDLAQVVRMAIADVIAGGGPKLSKSDESRTIGTFATIGPFRLTAPYRMLPKSIAAAARKLGVLEADVIRGALAQWLVDKGYGPKRTR